ncbi:MAG: class I SAM-dependent methyltransferase [Peptococcaceae bacterium]|nr:class I SAM-dependent methyltransferase [Peptococcaceae bacterium]
MADFDKKAPEYDAWYKTQKGALVDALETECAFSLFTPAPGMRVLDAGCGTGNFSLKMAALGAHVEGIDLSAPMIGYAREKAAASPYAEQLHFQVADLYELPFPDEYFDAVLSMAAFEFIHDDQRALDEFMRVVKPGGRVLIGTITGDSDWGIEYKSHMPREDSVFHHAAFKTAGEMRALLPEQLLASRESVFLPYATPEEKATRELDEHHRAAGAIGAFVCLLWEKPQA